MIRSQMSIMGLYNFNEDIFSGFEVPKEMDREVALQEILMQCAELELVYPTYTIMKLAISNWTKAELPIWERVYKDCTAEYDPLWNVDAHEERVITRERDGTSKDDTKVTNTNSGTDTTTVKGNDIASSKAYNQDNQAEWAERDKDFTDSENKFIHGKKNEDITDGLITDWEKETTTDIYDRHGNIGVTMATQLLSSDLELLPKLNPYKYIVDSFKRRFCLLVY